MVSESSLLRLRVKFEDPDGRGIHFETSGYLPGSVIAVVPGPLELNWLLRLDKPIHCYDVNGKSHIQSDFLLKPNGLDAEDGMKQLQGSVPDHDGFVAMAMILAQASIPKRIDKAEDYHQFPMVGDVRILIERKVNP